MYVILYFIDIKMKETLKSNLDSEKQLEIQDAMKEYKREQRLLESEINPTETEFAWANGNNSLLETVDGGKDRLTKSKWVFKWPSGTETWYDLPMKNVVKYMRDLGFNESKYNFWIRKDGVKMFGPYVMVAANIDANNKARKKGALVKTSLGMWIVCDKCERAYERGKENRLDIAVDWKNNNWA